MDANYVKGLETLRKMAGNVGDEAIKGMHDKFPDFADLMLSFGFGQIYSRQGMDIKYREIVTITSLITQGETAQLGLHLHCAINEGLTKEEIFEIILQCAAYCGFPKACAALIEADKFFNKNK